MGVFAKFVYTVAAVLGPGVGLDLPVAHQVTPAVPEVFDLVAQPSPVPVICPPVPVGVVAPPCAPTAPPSLRPWQSFCTAAPGVYTVTLRLGLVAIAGVTGGKVRLEGPAGADLLAAWTAAPGSPAYVAASLQVDSPAVATCYRIRLETSGPVEVIAEPGVSFVTVAR